MASFTTIKHFLIRDIYSIYMRAQDAEENVVLEEARKIEAKRRAEEAARQRAAAPGGGREGRMGAWAHGLRGFARHVHVRASCAACPGPEWMCGGPAGRAPGLAWLELSRHFCPTCS